MPDHHIVYYLDFQEQIFSVNMQSRQIEFVADIRRGRGFLKVSEQPATMSIRQSDGSRVIVIFWKRGLGLWCIEVQAMSRNVSRTCNVRDLWDGAVGIEEDQASVST
jgi:hypothetical protein